MLEQVEAEASETVVHAQVCVDGRLLGDYLQAREQLARLDQRTVGDEATQELSERFADLHRRVAERTHVYTFGCMPRLDRERLKDRFPPTASQKKSGLDADPAKFEPALAAATLVEIDGVAVEDDVERREEHFRRLWDALPEGDFGWGVIGRALGQANYEGTQVPLSVRVIGDRFVSALNSTMRRRTGSG